MALTPAEIFEHIGRALKYAADNMIPGQWDEANDVFLRFHDFVKIAKQYRLNGTAGTQAERAEAMRSMVGYLYEALTGRDPVADSHHFKNHWIEQIEPGEGGDY